ncbi:PhzF family phenazine biosynthesis protein [Heyndrickxia acidicola]|uniref:PhzF family phenazine biosynthesis protein n=1 Tax=Heyndrickxia acidicola TaxID=209389 RepID=A0ABU6MKQ5_9BACI|nr:PhzF family phenazine biosynthesis protein [Heyndrickxia acidicola]MED1205271.1 PhzF family phenazine biosynthesis protein [Heyndrickxia acidicola]
MKSIKVHHYDAFSSEPNKGNPAGVVLNGDELTEEEMQETAFKVGFNETAFTVQSDRADVRIRYFTPGQEVDLCGHATIATIFALHEKGLIGDKTDFSIETNAGILPIKISSHDHSVYITMRQAPPEFKDFNGSIEDLAHSIGLEKADIDHHIPIVYGSTGNWTLLIPIKSLDPFKKMKPNNKVFPAILTEMPKASIHPFCLETFSPNAHMHGRHFSSPYSGMIEDPVTGTASGVMGAYYAKYIDTNFKESLRLLVEQGQEMEKDGQVLVDVHKSESGYDIEITGNAVWVKDFEVKL